MRAYQNGQELMVSASLRDRLRAAMSHEQLILVDSGGVVDVMGLQVCGDDKDSRPYRLYGISADHVYNRYPMCLIVDCSVGERGDVITTDLFSAMWFDYPFGVGVF